MLVLNLEVVPILEEYPSRYERINNMFSYEH